jgi:hypothetical protein
LEKILDRAASYLTWKQQLLDDPETAWREANVPEIQKMQEVGEVCGHTSDLSRTPPLLVDLSVMK